jgi:hypothetical protein
MDVDQNKFGGPIIIAALFHVKHVGVNNFWYGINKLY